MKLGAPHHHAYVVEDIEATVNRLVDQLGAELVHGAGDRGNRVAPTAR